MPYKQEDPLAPTAYWQTRPSVDPMTTRGAAIMRPNEVQFEIDRLDKLRQSRLAPSVPAPALPGDMRNAIDAKTPGNWLATMHPKPSDPIASAGPAPADALAGPHMVPDRGIPGGGYTPGPPQAYNASMVIPGPIQQQVPMAPSLGTRLRSIAPAGMTPVQMNAAYGPATPATRTETTYTTPELRAGDRFDQATGTVSRQLRQGDPALYDRDVQWMRDRRIAQLKDQQARMQTAMYGPGAMENLAMAQRGQAIDEQRVQGQTAAEQAKLKMMEAELLRQSNNDQDRLDYQRAALGLRWMDQEREREMLNLPEDDPRRLQYLEQHPWIPATRKPQQQQVPPSTPATPGGTQSQAPAAENIGGQQGQLAGGPGVSPAEAAPAPRINLGAMLRQIAAAVAPVMSGAATSRLPRLPAGIPAEGQYSPTPPGVLADRAAKAKEDLAEQKKRREVPSYRDAYYKR